MNNTILLALFLLLQSVNIIHTQDEGCPVSENKCECILNHPEYGDVINCAGQGLTTVPVFQDASHTWDTLLLGSNLLIELTDGCFANLSVKNLYLEENDIYNIGENVFNDLSNYLEFIDLEDNRVTSSVLTSIHDLPYLNSINLNYNLITELTNKHFIGLPSLTQLSFSFNELVSLSSSSTDNIPTLTHLGFHGNSIRIIDDEALQGLTALVKLDFGLNNLPQVPTYNLGGLSNLEDFSIWGNDITEFKEDDFLTLSSTVTSLNIGQNPVSTLPENLFRTIPNLRYLDLDLMNLNSFPEMIFENMTDLYQLSMSGNLFTEIPDILSDSPELTFFTASYNFITEIKANDFIHNRELYYLKLDGNSISIVNESLFCNHDYLGQLYLNDNDIVNFDACAPLTVSGLTIDLNGNPLHCGCDILWLKQRNRLQNTANTICATPLSLAGLAINEISDEQFQCDLEFEEECSNACD